MTALTHMADSLTLQHSIKKITTMTMGYPYTFQCRNAGILLTILFTASLRLSCPAWGADELVTESPTTLGKVQDITNRASELALNAMGMIGIRYKFGGNTPENGLDCSGLVRHVFKEVWGAILPRTSIEISHLGEKVDPKNLEPGDLVFYNTLKKKFSHVGIYLGDNKFIHSPSVGGQVRIESMEISYWKKHFSGARRMKDPEQK